MTIYKSSAGTQYIGKYYCVSISKNLFWFRLFDKGISVGRRPLKFSERYGYTKYLQLGNYVVNYLW